MTRVVAALGTAAIAIASPAAQEQARFRGGADLVSIYATVIDSDGRLVTDLTKDDFEVYDNGRLQAVTLFSNDLQPISVVMMIDRSGSMQEHFNLIRDGAMAFVTKMLPDDRARIGSFASEILISPAAFTGDQDVLNDVLRHELQRVGPSPVWAAIDRSITALQSEQGRRVVLAFTDGHNQAARGQPITHLKDVQRRMRFNEIMIYAIGFAAETLQMTGGQAPQGPAPGAIPGIGVPAPGARAQYGFVRRVQPPDPALKELAEESGGGYFEMSARDDLGATFARVAEELHRQYWIGFTPAKLDGKSHEITVKVKRSGVKVRARKSYEAKSSSGDSSPAQPRQGRLRYN